VELVLHAPRMRSLIGEGLARTYGPALTEALGRLEAQVARRKRTPKARRRAAAGA
jgi:hypothetical protein